MGLLTKITSAFRKHKATDDFWYTFTGNTALAGIQVTEDNALKLSAVWACIKVLSETIASLPLHIYERLDKGKRKANDYKYYDLLHTQPNSELSSMRFREIIMLHLGSWGNFFAEKQRQGSAGRIVGLWPISPSRVKVGRDKYTNEIRYTVKLTGSEPERIFTRENMLHIAGLGGDGLVGYSPIRMAREAIGLGLACEEFGARFFGNGTHPSMIVEHPGKLSPNAHKSLKDDLMDKNSGLGKAHRLMLLEEGMKAQNVGIPPEDAQFLETRVNQVYEICRFYRMPPHKIQELSKATYSNIEHQSIEFVVDTIMPWLVRIEQELNIQILGEIDRRKYFCEHLISGLLRGDIQSRYNAYAVGRQWGWLSADDIRELENMNPIGEEKGGNIYLVPLNMVSAENAGEEPATKEVPPPEEEEKSACSNIEHRKASFKGRKRLEKVYYSLFQDAGERIVRREGVAIKRASQKYLGQRNKIDFQQWIDEFYRDLPDYIQKNMMPVLMSYAESIQAEAAQEVNAAVGMTPELQDFVRKYLDKYTQRHIKSSIGQLRELIEETVSEELAEAIETRADEWEERRADKIAMRETVQANNAVASFVFFGVGLGLVWRAIGESCPYCLELNGKRISQGQVFVNGNTDFQPQGADTPMLIRTSKMHPPLHEGCDCQVEAG